MMKGNALSRTRACVAAIVALQLGACSTPSLDRRIAALNAEIVTQRDTLAPLAARYRGRAGQDVQFDVVGRPIEDTIEAYNNSGSKTMTIQSYDFSGYIARGWTDCIWPFNGRIGYEVVPAFDQAFAGVLHIEQIDHSWN